MPGIWNPVMPGISGSALGGGYDVNSPVTPAAGPIQGPGSPVWEAGKNAPVGSPEWKQAQSAADAYYRSLPGFGGDMVWIDPATGRPGSPPPGATAPTSYAGGATPQTSHPSTTPTTTPSTAPTTTPQSIQNQVDPFTSWLSQQNVFPYTQSTLGMSGWNPATRYNPASTGYNPSAMPNYTMDTYP